MFADQELASRIHAHLRYMSSLTGETALRVRPDWFPAIFDSENTHAMFCGPNSPLTKAEGSFDSATLERLTAFYRGRTRQYEAVVTPFSEPGAAQALYESGARTMMWENVLYRPLSSRLEPAVTDGNVRVIRVTDKERQAWKDVSRRGFFGEDESELILNLADLMDGLGETDRYLAYCGDEPAGAAMQIVANGTAFLGGAATLEDFRGRGVQQALLAARLQDARAGADLAFLGALPGSVSQRNAERAGFQIAYSSLSFSVPVPSGEA